MVPLSSCGGDLRRHPRELVVHKAVERRLGLGVRVESADLDRAVGGTKANELPALAVGLEERGDGFGWHGGGAFLIRRRCRLVFRHQRQLTSFEDKGTKKVHQWLVKRWQSG